MKVKGPITVQCVDEWEDPEDREITWRHVLFVSKGYGDHDTLVNRSSFWSTVRDLLLAGV